jgi:hypothetical protein
MFLNLGMASRETIPVPYRGINASDPLIGLDSSYALFSYNLVSTSYGLKVRNGYDEWCTNVVGHTTDDTIKSLLPFQGATAAALFAATDEGIYNVTTQSASPTKVVTFSAHSESAGWIEWTHYVTTASHYLVLCDEVNGYYHYTEAGTWTKPAAGAGAGQVNGVDPANLCFVMQWKERLFFIERDTSAAWYLPVGQVTGTVSKFDFGNKFRRGGKLVGLYSWTIDGGIGIDDHLVAISSAGDVIVYKGTNPDAANTFELVGQWVVGNLPLGRRIAAKVGGDLWILSLFGIIPLSKLLSGAEITDKDTFITNKITPVISSLMSTRSSTRGWEIRLNPSDSLVMISVPKISTADYIQIAYGIDRPSWSLFRDIPYMTGELFEKNFYIGTDDGRVLKYADSTDNGKDINFSLMGAYKPTQRITQVGFIKPLWISTTIPAYGITAKYDYDMNELHVALSTTTAASGGWDSGKWDKAVWSGYQKQNTMTGVAGLGTAVAVAIRGSSNADSTLLGFEAIFNQGGLM